MAYPPNVGFVGFCSVERAPENLGRYSVCSEIEAAGVLGLDSSWTPNRRSGEVGVCSL